MRPGTESALVHAEVLPPHLVAEGALYAAALLDRIKAGTSSPADVAGVFVFLAGGPALHGFADVIFEALCEAHAARLQDSA